MKHISLGLMVLYSTFYFTCNAAIWTYPGPSGDMYKSSKYQVNVKQNGTTLSSFVYEDNNKNQSNLGSMTNFNHFTTFSFNGTVTIEVVKLSGTIGSAEIRPLSRNYVPTVNGNKLTFILTKPEKLWIKMTGMYEDPLFVFADEPEVNPPTASGPDLVYWGPGVHEVGKHYRLQANKTYYLAGGAYVKGSFLSDNNASNITIKGRGILSGEKIAHCGYSQCVFDGVAIRFQGSGNTNLTLEGITLINPAQYCVQAYGGKLMTRNVKFFGWWYETDGWVAGNDTELSHCFFKVYDDVVKLYFDRLHIHDLVIYKQHNGAPFQLGWGSESGSDNLIENIDVMTDETNWNESGLSGNRGFINHANGNSSGVVENMTFQNIRFDDQISYLIGVKSQGKVRNFVLKNILVKGTQKFKSYMAGGNISGFSLQNVKINGVCVSKDADINLQKSGTVATVTYLGCNVPVPNNPPSITLTATSGSAVAPANLNLMATATDTDGSIAKVEFYEGNTLLGEDLVSPYAFSLPNRPSGLYTFTAKATDNLGAVAFSVPVQITILVPNTPPTVSLSVSTQSAYVPAIIPLSAAAGDVDGSIVKVEFFVGDVLLGIDSAAPFAFSWNVLTEGDYELKAKAWDDRGASAWSAPVAITLLAKPAYISDLSAVAQSCTTVKLTWTDGSGETGYRVRRRLAGVSTYSNIQDLPSNSTSYIDPSAAPNTSYVYMVRPLINGTAVELSNTPEIRTPVCSSLRIGVEESEEFISIDPNPFVDGFYAELSGNVSVNKVLLSDAQGQEVSLVWESLGQGMIRVQADHLASGVYYIKIFTTSGCLNKRIVKL